MQRPARTPGTVGVPLIVTACVLLLGILLTGYGHLRTDRLLLAIGLVVTIAGLVAGVLQVAIHPRR